MNPLLQENDKWQLMASILADVLGARFAVTVLSNSSASDVKTIIKNVSAEQYQLVIPIGQETGSPVVAAGTLQAKPTELLRKLLGLAVRYVHETRAFEEQRLDLDACMYQISQDFEALSWLRHLLQHLKECDVAGSAEDFADAVLVSLCTTIEAEAVALISADREGTPAGQEVPLVGKVIAKVGPREQDVNEKGCCQLVDRLRGVAGAQPLVQNDMKGKREFSMVPGVHSCILAPATRQNFFFGWLLAVNRNQTSSEPEPAMHNAILHVSQGEFGTVEANLMDAAAVMLATQARCVELLAEKVSATEECPVSGS